MQAGTEAALVGAVGFIVISLSLRIEGACSDRSMRPGR